MAGLPVLRHRVDPALLALRYRAAAVLRRDVHR
jgi:hypothetical protein